MLSGATPLGSRAAHAPVPVYQLIDGGLLWSTAPPASFRHGQFARLETPEERFEATLTCSCYDICVNDQTTAITMRADLVAISFRSSVGCLTAGLGHLGYLNLVSLVSEEASIQIMYVLGKYTH